MTKDWSLAAIMSAASLASCTPDVPMTQYVPPSAPSPATALAGARQAAEEEALVGLIERSEVREADPPLGPGRYVLCVRGANKVSAIRRTYAVFFDNDDYKGARMSVILDGCEKQAFAPMPPAEPASGPMTAQASSRLRPRQGR
ncbi:hypothetical protein [Bradyrhizobium sp.]|uniref:hypothetical protein n=2 Tax=Bradyrhizobium sp. TaxID=376 RepID=UPI001EC28CF1|nr:hypothetical protein [Bradyrhizobium sp.]MBV9982491.1 hypothetical protein [Bradyrhizobium sp.]